MDLFLKLPFLLLSALFLQPISPLEFLFNDFDSSSLLLSSDSQLVSGRLVLTNDTTFSIGHAFYPLSLTTRPFLSPFSTSFIFSITPNKDLLPGHGIALFFAPTTALLLTSPAEYLGLFNQTSDRSPQSHIFAIEFDTSENPDLADIDDNHVGVDVNNATSVASHSAGKWDSGKFEGMDLKNGENYQAWVDYYYVGGNNSMPRLNVSMALAGQRKPGWPLISLELNLTSVFNEEAYVGFSAATGQRVETHRILGWSFSERNFSLSEGLVTSGLPDYRLKAKNGVIGSKAFIVGLSNGGLVVFGLILIIGFLWFRKRRNRGGEDEGIEDWEIEYWPHRVPYQDILSATKNFSETQLLGNGGNSRVFKGVLAGSRAEVAIKCVSHESQEGVREFAAEVSSIGRLKHRNLVGLRGWCKSPKEFILVYDYMENGSLDNRIFQGMGGEVMGWAARVRVLKGLADGVLYLHEGWEARILHRDIKASNVMLDEDMCAKLGDFGLARMYEHGQLAHTTRVVGTAGYMAPEMVRSGKASVKTDVFSFGVLILEVVCGRRPLEDGCEPLVEWVWSMLEQGDLIGALDPRLSGSSEVDEEVVDQLLRLGLLCTCPNPSTRPTMRQVVRTLEDPGSDDLDGDSVVLRPEPKLGFTDPVWSWRPGPSEDHPTFGDLQLSPSWSMSISDSDVIVDGR
ncbi:L-type lectin-domain containing receptor kinase VII.1 isoform X1 [Amborella trichopoda]|uniref:non-specific serine/threonine protein kinase n=1 Tax=Amborella trichopoda TaxID=13333 RepID=U5D4G5_AMBTC|nr:L-type lectin-domain containing receptor kinase VII.1 isoform X1 [Amborella trichopoda]XP_020532108.1 L-type lectin-domain containing receptor kinase VII.1 isoform X1 [Amborella trichopoda]ERN20496.1 hypothetical protein AMTR_s00068p00175830 [Amborella trichopoda]|eukprot:XP_006859029.1 L-type lectin-domain containing receptor kinase VII.1 isoform X1 [Amborella trichopoda]